MMIEYINQGLNTLQREEKNSLRLIMITINDIEIKKLETEFQIHLITCYNQYLSEADDLNYHMAFIHSKNY